MHARRTRVRVAVRAFLSPLLGVRERLVDELGAQLIERPGGILRFDGPFADLRCGVPGCGDELESVDFPLIDFERGDSNALSLALGLEPNRLGLTSTTFTSR